MVRQVRIVGGESTDALFEINEGNFEEAFQFGQIVRSHRERIGPGRLIASPSSANSCWRSVSSLMPSDVHQTEPEGRDFMTCH